MEAGILLNPIAAPLKGREQLVYPREDGRLDKYFYVDRRLEVEKQMEQGMFGEIVGKEIRTRPASPAEAMARIAWFNAAYPQAEIRIEGISPDGVIHTSQPFIGGRIPVSFRDMVEALKNDGWESYFAADGDPSTDTFYHPRWEVFMKDVHEQNGKIITGPDKLKRFQPYDVVFVVPAMDHIGAEE